MTWKCNNVDYFKLDGYDLYYNNGDLNQSDDVIYVTNKLSRQTEVINCGNKKLRTKIRVSNKTIFINSLYKSPHTNVAIFIETLTQYIAIV